MSRTTTFDPRTFRTVLGHFPTGVAAITAVDGDGVPVGMAVGSFTSVSLDPPLVAFLPDKSSSSFPRIRATGSFCVNVLAGDQETVCRSFAAKGADKFAGIHWRPAGSGSPILEGAVAWIDCDIDVVHDAGDHHIVVGRVRELDADADRGPLLFFQGGYGQFSSPSRSAPAEPDLLEHLRLLDCSRPEMERIAAELDLECLAVTRIRDEIVILGSAGEPRRPTSASRIGQRSPFVAPLGALFVAPEDDAALHRWLAPPDATTARTDTQEEQYRSMVARAHERGWSVVLSSTGQTALEAAVGRLTAAATQAEYEAVRLAALNVGADAYEPELEEGREYAVSHLSAPVRNPDGDTALVLSLYGLPRPCGATRIAAFRDRLLVAASVVERSVASTS